MEFTAKAVLVSNFSAPSRGVMPAWHLTVDGCLITRDSCRNAAGPIDLQTWQTSSHADVDRSAARPSLAFSHTGAACVGAADLLRWTHAADVDK